MTSKYIKCNKFQTINGDNDVGFFFLRKDAIWMIGRSGSGERRIRTSEVERQQIYSLPHLAALESPQKS